MYIQTWFKVEQIHKSYLYCIRSLVLLVVCGNIIKVQGKNHVSNLATFRSPQTQQSSNYCPSVDTLLPAFIHLFQTLLEDVIHGLLQHILQRHLILCCMFKVTALLLLELKIVTSMREIYLRWRLYGIYQILPLI